MGFVYTFRDVFGRWYKELKENQSLFFSKMLIVGSIFLCIGIIFNFIDSDYHFGDYYHLGPGGSILLMGLNLIFLWLVNIIVTSVKPNKIFQSLIFCSKHVTSLYVIQWTIINWGMYLIGFWNHKQVSIILLIPLVITLSISIQILYNRIKKEMKRSQKKVVSVASQF